MILVEEAKKTLLAMIHPLMKELDEQCFSNCTVDLVNTLHNLCLVSAEGFNEVAESFESMTHQEKVDIWIALQTEGAIKVKNLNIDRVVMAVLQIQFCVLLAHRATCQTMNPGALCEPITGDAPKTNVIQFPTKKKG